MEHSNTNGKTEHQKRPRGRPSKGRKMPFSVGLSDRAKAGLEAESRRTGLSQASIVEVYCRELAMRNGVPEVVA